MILKMQSWKKHPLLSKIALVIVITMILTANASMLHGNAEAIDGRYDVTCIHGNAEFNRINLVFLSNGYQASEMDRFMEKAKFLKNILFHSKAFKGMENCFNVYAIKTPSLESSYDKDLKYPGEYFFNTGVHPQVERMLVMSKESVDPFFVTQKVIPSAVTNPEATFCIILQNSSKWAGSGGPRTIICDDIHYRNLVYKSDLMFLHEFAHSYAQLGDEYDFELKNIERIRHSKNLSLSKNDPPWKKLLGQSINGLNIETIPVDSNATYFRATNACIMKDFEHGKDFCPICVNAIRTKTAMLKQKIIEKMNYVAAIRNILNMI